MIAAKWVWQCSNKTLFPNQVVGHIWPRSHTLLAIGEGRQLRAGQSKHGDCKSHGSFMAGLLCQVRKPGFVRSEKKLRPALPI